MNFVKLVIQIGVLFGVYSIGAWIQQYFNLFIPGSVIGLVLMFTLLTTGILKANWIEKGARFMINHLVLFFIPATVGVLNYYDLFKGKGILLIVITVVSTLFVMLSSGVTSQMLAKERDISNE
ncbi:CidA/LrgA family protein [Pseudogracilibacillus sp. SO30301A]|uniref:CidA/LrgA family protein n=1 Tax=Pseudogracilibacillus sp. SO30301A TaxID=3098291 RepID=UPI00300E05DD